MKRLWVLVAVGAVSLLAAVGVAGLPSTVPDDVVIADRPAPVTTTTTPTTPPPTPATDPTVTAPTDAPPETSAVIITTTTTEPSVPATEPTTAVTLAPAVPTSQPVSTSTTLADVAGVRVVVVNATSQPGLGADTAAFVDALGYPNPVPIDAIDKDAATSLVYFEEGFRGEAERLAEQFQLVPTNVARMPDQPIAVDNPEADLWFLVGADRVP